MTPKDFDEMAKKIVDSIRNWTIGEANSVTVEKRIADAIRLACIGGLEKADALTVERYPDHYVISESIKGEIYKYKVMRE